MPKLIRVHSKFNLLKNYGDKIRFFDVGLHEVSDEDAGHWFVKGNSDLVKDLSLPEEDAPIDKANKKALSKKNATSEEPVVKDKGDPQVVEIDDDSYFNQVKKKVWG